MLYTDKTETDSTDTGSESPNKNNLDDSHTNIKLKEFKLNRMVNNPSILIIANRGSGKSWLIRELMRHFSEISAGAIIAPTDRMNPFYRYFFPQQCIHYDIRDQLLRGILDRQCKMITKSKQAKSGADKIDPQALLVMDDCLARKRSWAKDSDITEVLMNARHYKLTYILTMQTPLGVTPDLRLNFDYIFLLKDDSTINKKKLWDNYASMFHKFNTFEQVFDQCTKDYGCMVIDNRKPADNINKKIFHFKVNNLDPKFLFGSDQFRNFDLANPTDNNMFDCFVNKIDYPLDYHFQLSKDEILVNLKNNNSEQNKNDTNLVGVTPLQLTYNHPSCNLVATITDPSDYKLIKLVSGCFEKIKNKNKN